MHIHVVTGLVWCAYMGTAAAAAVQPGLFQIVWGNSAGAGAANTTSIVATPDGSWGGYTSSFQDNNSPSNGAVSVEYLGMLTAPKSGPVRFACNATRGTVIMWLDDHIFCGSDSLFPSSGGVAPLPPYMVLTAKQSYFIRIQLVRNVTATVTMHRDEGKRGVGGVGVGPSCQDKVFGECGAGIVPGFNVTCCTGHCGSEQPGTPTVCIPSPLSSFQFASPSSASPMTFQLQWAEGYGVAAGISAAAAPFGPIPATVFTAAVPPAQEARLGLQRTLATGWGTWSVYIPAFHGATHGLTLHTHSGVYIYIYITSGVLYI